MALLIITAMLITKAMVTNGSVELNLDRSGVLFEKLGFSLNKCKRTTYRLAKDQLNTVLGFFPRRDAKISVLLSVNIAMLALLAGKAPLKELQWNSTPALVAFLALALIALSLIFLYQASFPRPHRWSQLTFVLSRNCQKEGGRFYR